MTAQAASERRVRCARQTLQSLGSLLAYLLPRVIVIELGILFILRVIR
jgi:hypothetical protein